MKQTIAHIGKALLIVLVLYLAYALIASTLAHIIPKKVSGEAKERFAQATYVGTGGEGPDRVMLVERMDEAFGVRIALLRGSTRSVDMTYHTVQEGSSTDAFFGEVVKAADRGVRVRIVLDGKAGDMEAGAKRLIRLLERHENISCKRFNPVRLLRPWEWHTLIHDKFIIVDDELLLLGGRNLGDRFYAPEGYTGKTVDDREVLIHGKNEPGSVIPEIKEYMELLWEHPLSNPYPESREGPAAMERLVEAAAAFQESNPRFYAMPLEEYIGAMVPTGKISLIANPVHTGQKEPWVGYILRQLAREAQRSVTIQTPYSTANKELLAALDEAAGRAEVTILTNSMASSPNYPAFSNYYFNRKKFLETGASIYEYQSTHSIHGKSIVYDDRISAVGSFNMDDRSFYIDTETMLIIDSPAFAAILNGAIGGFLDRSLKVGEDNQYEPREAVEAEPVPAGKKLLMFVASLVSRLVPFLI